MPRTLNAEDIYDRSGRVQHHLAEIAGQLATIEENDHACRQIFEAKELIRRAINEAHMLPRQEPQKPDSVPMQQVG